MALPIAADKELSCEEVLRLFPITATPILDAEEWRQLHIEMAENAKKGIPREEILRGIELFKGVMRNSSPAMRLRLGVPDDI
jgi:hypothetical protein